MKKLSIIFLISLFLLTPVFAGETDGTVSCWALEEASGTRSDTIGSNTLADNNTVTGATGKVGDASDFERDNDEYLSITDASQVGLDVTTAFTIAGWVNFEVDTGAGELWMFNTKVDAIDTDYSWAFGYRQYGGTEGMFFGETSDGDNSSTGVNGLVSWSPTAGTFYHVAVVFDGSQTGANRVRYYINGAGSYSGTTTWHSAVFSGGASLRLGGAGITSWYFDGIIDEMVFYDEAKTDDDITALYNSGTGVTCASLLPSVESSIISDFLWLN